MKMRILKIGDIIIGILFAVVVIVLLVTVSITAAVIAIVWGVISAIVVSIAVGYRVMSSTPNPDFRSEEFWEDISAIVVCSPAVFFSAIPLYIIGMVIVKKITMANYLSEKYGN